MKKTVIAMLACILLFNIAVRANISTDLPIDININGTFINTDVRPFLVSGTTYVPVRFIGEAIGAQVSWDEAEDTAIINGGGTVIALPISSRFAYINGVPHEIEHNIRLLGDRTFAPARFIAESLGAEVDWDGAHLTVQIKKENVIIPHELAFARGYTDNDVYWLGRIINAEAEGEPMTGKIGVGNVVLNRVKSGLYPNSIYGVIFDDDYGVQFEPVLNGRIYNTPSFDSLVAAKYCLQGENVAGGSLFFLNPSTAASLWIADSRQYYTAIGNHSFYL